MAKVKQHSLKSVRVSDRLWRDLKVHAVIQGLTIESLISDLIVKHVPRAPKVKK